MGPDTLISRGCLVPNHNQTTVLKTKHKSTAHGEEQASENTGAEEPHSLPPTPGPQGGGSSQAGPAPCSPSSCSGEEERDGSLQRLPQGLAATRPQRPSSEARPLGSLGTAHP